MSTKGGAVQNLVPGEHPNWSRDGRYLIYDNQGDLWYIDMTGTPQPFSLLQTPFFETQPVFSPDGRHAAFVSTESGRSEVYVILFPLTDGDRWQVSIDGGTAIRWSAQSNEIFFVEPNMEFNGGTLMVAAIDTSEDFNSGIPQRLFTGEQLRSSMRGGSSPHYDVTGDGQRIVIPQRIGADSDTYIIAIVQNWYAEFKDQQ